MLDEKPKNSYSDTITVISLILFAGLVIFASIYNEIKRNERKKEVNYLLTK